MALILQQIPAFPTATCGVVTCVSHSHLSAVQPSQATTQVSIHDIMDRPWPTTLASKKAFEKALADALNSQRIKAMNVKEVSPRRLA